MVGRRQVRSVGLLGSFGQRFSLKVVSTTLGTFALALQLSAVAEAADVLYKYQGKAVSRKDLPVPEQQKISDLELDFHKHLTDVIHEAALNQHLDSLAKKLGKARVDVEASILSVTAPTDDEVKAWYDQNKDRIPPDYSFDKVKGDIRGLLQQEKSARKKSEVLAGLKKSGEIQVVLKDPDVPTVAIDVAGRPVLGDSKAPLTLVEFADYQCPHCQAAGKAVKAVLKKYPGKIKLVFMDFPVNPSGISRQVAQGGFCAEKQGKYWEYHEMAFAKQKDLNSQSPEEFAKTLGLKVDDFKTCLSSPDALAKVNRDTAEGQKVGVTGTPTLFLNGKKVRSYEEEELGKAVEQALQSKSS